MEALTVRGRSRTRIEIDLNSRNRDGYVRARLARATGEVVVGDVVTVFEPEDQVAAVAVVVRVDKEAGFVYLTVHWDTLADDAEIVQIPALNRAKNSWQVPPRFTVEPTSPPSKKRHLRGKSPMWAKFRRRARRLLAKLPSVKTDLLVTTGGKARIIKIDAQTSFNAGSSSRVPVRLQKVS